MTLLLTGHLGDVYRSRLGLRRRRTVTRAARSQLLPPARENPVHARRADDRTFRNLELRRVEDERSRLRAADAAVERDQLFEGAALVEIRDRRSCRP